MTSRRYFELIMLPFTGALLAFLLLLWLFGQALKKIGWVED